MKIHEFVPYPTFESRDLVTTSLDPRENRGPEVETTSTMAAVSIPSSPKAGGSRPSEVETLIKATPANHDTAASTMEPKGFPKARPRIIDASAGFDLEDYQVPSTSPGDADDMLAASSYSSPRFPEPGARVGRYLTEELLGRGGMGVVLKARDDLLQREVAIKVILPQYLAQDPAAGFRFLREAEIVARLEHPNIIRVLDAGLDSGIAYLCFEYVRGITYGTLRKQGGTSTSQAIDLLLPVLSALSYAHRLGVVHGDLKPSNLLLSSDYAGRAHPLVLDFGVSFFSDVEAGLDPTRKRVSGTPGYLAPEWLNGEGVDGRADCFSLGCVLYEMLAGRGPFFGMTRLSEAVEAAKRREYKNICAVSQAPIELKEIIDRALHPDPAQRFSTVSAFGQALLEFASARVALHYEREFSKLP